jgi:hypothetical protein
MRIPKPPSPDRAALFAGPSSRPPLLGLVSNFGAKPLGRVRTARLAGFSGPKPWNLTDWDEIS